MVLQRSDLWEKEKYRPKKSKGPKEQRKPRSTKKTGHTGTYGSVSARAERNKEHHAFCAKEEEQPNELQADW